VSSPQKGRERGLGRVHLLGGHGRGAGGEVGDGPIPGPRSL